MSDLSKIKWRCRRGVKELDIVLCNYVEKYIENEKINEKALTTAFQELLELEDPILYSLLLGELEADSKSQQKVLHRLRTVKKE